MLVSWPALRSKARWSAAFCVLLALSAPAPARSSDLAGEMAGGAATGEASDPVTALIVELGAGDYASRERAQAKLQRMGLDVFDQLYEAQSSDDIEIAMRARYLLRSLTVRWSQDDDPLPVRELLRAYGDRTEDERRSLIEQLAKLPDSQGTKAVCRIVRFETSNVLSKRAALAIMQRKTAAANAPLASLSDTITESLGTSRREAANWLRVYAATLKEPAGTLPDWERISAEEEQAFQNTPDRSAPDIVRDLFRWRADLLEQVGRVEESRAVIVKTIDLLDGTRQQLVDAVDWLLVRRAWATIIDVSKRFPERFQESTLLLYRLAEAQSQSGQRQEAEKTAEQALNSNQDSQQEHTLAAYSLQERGLFEWSEREYRHVLGRVPPAAPEGFQARLLFSEMLHDMQREQDAATVLREIVEASEKDENIRYMISRFRSQPGSVASRMYFFLAEHARASGDQEKQIEHLKRAIQFDPTDADVLIGIYRASQKDPSWRKETLGLISDAVQTFREEVRDYEGQAAEAPTEGHRADIHRELASAHNQLAWLVANTQGDYDEALRSSQRSLELRPETAGYLDTLAQCYYAKGDYTKAVVHQSRAAELDPHSGQILRQLDFFKRAAEKQFR
ncbi:MAG: tetratricopeptide repeat protein [Pirellulaceae bacterium]|nr:tetratricopeptide repeat protein [Pirellulaceae bacterium]